MFVLYRYAVKEKIGDVQILGCVLPIEDAEKAQYFNKVCLNIADRRNSYTTQAFHC